MTTIAQFSKNIRKRGRQVENGASKVVRASAKKFLRDAVGSTPVDTGKARSNWRVGVGQRPRKVIEPYAPYPKNSKALGQGKSERANANAAISAGIAKINTLRGVPSAGLKTALYVTNLTPYIGFLEARHGMSEKASVSARSAVKGFKLLDSRNNTSGD